MKEFGSEKLIFVCTDSTETFFSKLRSACLTITYQAFFTDYYCAGEGGGVSNKNCLLTFFIVYSYFMPVCSIVKTISPRCRGLMHQVDALLHEAEGRVHQVVHGTEW